MNIEKFKVLGVMSGTSLDGIDCAVVEFTKQNADWSFRLISAETIAYAKVWQDKLQNALHLSEADLHLLNIEYTHFLGGFLADFIRDNNLNDLDFISSHGHTVLHQPENGITLQIGNLPTVTDMISLPFVCDFRVQDVQLGGQGAPLVPMGDRLLFSEYDYCLNLGGFSNISFEQDGKRTAFDICPVNTLLNHFAKKIGKEFDESGNFAASGTINNGLFNELNNLSFYNQQGPKSLGIEQVHAIYLPLIEKYQLTAQDSLSTVTEHIAYQIASILTKENAKLLVTGGGAFNEHLINRLKIYSPHTTIVLGSKELIEFKEAIIFAFLGVLRITNVPNVLSSVTGATHDHCAGVVFNQELLPTNC
ncbi:anhydro-N-acetylmuramic acid kinase [Paenimyroides aestuarii]|uniref:Anhydro-N-acetylmuramic acid kinase n=1 Tax=Paenimyroides aestuarii TaxID=2968490 RepID=A0ABY5NPY9_9FLAO|nr:anhydro-N-acetylmuramic acid kinase [Paenimyroides aestuarii]UUV20563.1 anhydro-N-acetylmuramic acid kinase [Paenimyroides aestuarii]